MKRRRVALALAALTLLACQATTSHHRRSPAGGAADFKTRDIDGKRLRLSDFHDKTVVIVFWSSWCTSCFGKLRYIDGLYREHKARGLVIIGVAMDLPQTRARVKPAVRRYKLSFPVFIDANNQVINRFNPRRTESLTLLMRGGRVIERWAPLNVADLAAFKGRVEAEIARHQRPAK